MAQTKVNLAQLRYWIYIGVLGLFFVLWLARLFRLQILQGASYASEAVQVTERRERLSAKRGLIYYRDDQTPIVDNTDVFTVSITPGHVPPGKLQAELNLLAKVLDTDRRTLAKSVAGSRDLLQPVVLQNDVHLLAIQKIAERRDRLLGVSYTSRPERNLLDNNSVIHIVGYVRKISDYELEVLYNDRYRKNINIGKTGIEQYYDTILRGYDGSRIQVVDAKGKILDERIDPPNTGASLTLSLDRRVQKLAEQALGDHIGTAIVLRPATGEILAMVSKPWYNLEDFSSEERYRALLQDPRKPLLNRAIQSQYPPASTFKLVTATAMLGEHSFSPREYIFDPGYWQLGNRKFRCWLRSGHGNQNLPGAIANSCNVYFGIVGVRHVGQASLSKYARMYGFGQLTEIDLPGEIAGLVPGPQWKYQNYEQPWTQGDTLNMSIGQGFLLATPLQVAVYTSAIVNDGLAYKPFLLKKIRNNEGSNEARENLAATELLYDMQLDASVFQQIKHGMRQAVLRGTARGTVYNGVVDVAAKTGTAEIGIGNNWHSWFVSFGPYETDDPAERIVVVTQVEADPTVPKEKYDWWAPRAADIIYRGIFAGETYEQVWLNYQRRRVWYHSLMKVPEKYRQQTPAAKS